MLIPRTPSAPGRRRTASCRRRSRPVPRRRAWAPGREKPTTISAFACRARYERASDHPLGRDPETAAIHRGVVRAIDAGELGWVFFPRRRPEGLQHPRVRHLPRLLLRGRRGG
ncbi:hypothetical protein ACQ4WX_25330 [Streptomyces lasalocidi]